MLGRFRYDPKDEIKTQTESDAVQPYKFYFGEPRIGDQAGTAAGGGHEKEKKKKKNKPQKNERKGETKGEEKSAGGGGEGISYHHYRFGLPPLQIWQCPTMFSRLSLCAGVEAPARTRSGSNVASKRARGLRGTCAVLL